MTDDAQSGDTRRQNEPPLTRGISDPDDTFAGILIGAVECADCSHEFYGQVPSHGEDALEGECPACSATYTVERLSEAP